MPWDTFRCCYNIPVVSLAATTAPKGVPWHSWSVVASSGMSIGHKGMLHAAKALGMTMVDIFKDSVINLCRTHKIDNKMGFQLASGSFDTLIKLSKEGLGMTLLPYLHTLDLNDIDKNHLREFTDPTPAREVSLIYHKSQLKMQLIEALKKTIDGVVRGAISFSDVKIISPLPRK